jgi:hypothetical protein
MTIHTRNDLTDLEALQWEFENQLVAVEAWTRPRGGGISEASAYKVKPPKFDGFMSRIVFHC